MDPETRHFLDGRVEMHVGSCLDVLPHLAAESVDCVVTSPPYFGLRDYGTAAWVGGDPACDHRKITDAGAAVASSTLQGGKRTTGHLQEGFVSACRRCGARRVDRQIGMEETPTAYVEALVAVFREVRRVLKRTGTLWLNLGDSYAGSWGARGRGEGTNAPRPDLEKRHGTRAPNRRADAEVGIKPKDLIGIPWMVALALRADGWWLRKDVIWSKPNPMPENVSDRPTSAHEYLFMFSRAPRYYYDGSAIAERSTYPGDNRSVRTDTRKTHDPFCADKGSRARTGNPTGETRNRRSVWTVATQPFDGAHFATFPPALIEPCILAGCPKDGVVLDPFGGAGTTGLVALRHGRRAVLIELNPDYADMTQRRIEREWGEAHPPQDVDDIEALALFAHAGGVAE